jgi:putative NADH-flavin reductase
MQITVFGASGKIGMRVVSLLLEQGHTVVAFVHSHDPFAFDSKLKVRHGDIRDPRAVEDALKGSQAVISTLGSWGKGPKDVLTAAMGVVIPEMKTAKIKRIISLTGADALLPKERPRGVHKVFHALLGVGAAKILHDGERHMAMLAGSKLQWTVLRSPIMRSFGSHKFRLTTYPLSPLATVHRQAVAEVLVKLLDRPKTIGKAPFITHK